MNVINQALTVIGLIFELSSVLYQAKKTFHPFKSKEQKKIIEIEEEGKTLLDQIEARERNWFWTLFLLFIGLLLQAIAVLEII